MPFDLNDLVPAGKFFYPDNDGKEWVKFRPTTPGLIRELRSKHVHRDREMHVEEREGNLASRVHGVEFDRIDEEGMFADTWDHHIADWHLIGPDGEDIPCNRKNKLLLINGSKEFGEFSSKCILLLEKDTIEQEDKKAKNCSTSQKRG